MGQVNSPMTNFNATSITPSQEHKPSSPSPTALFLLLVISFYQRMRAGRIAPCRFFPSCSEYAHEAVLVHGTVRGTALALRRLSKCRPLGPHGIDLVPVAKKVRTTTS
jgi:putative membrane protein insertion efficiency factor